MKAGDDLRPIWPIERRAVGVIDQRLLPHEYKEIEINDLDGTCAAISDMVVRGAPLIGATAAYGIALQANTNPEPAHLQHAGAQLVATRPTAVNLKWAVDRMLTKLADAPVANIAQLAWEEADALCQEDVAINKAIGTHGLEIIQRIAKDKGGARVNILTHCNAGWLACVAWGTATSAIYQAHAAGIDVHVWVDETRPRNQGAFLTAWELGQAGVAHTVIADNAGGHLMQHGQVDMCIVGTDRTAANGDVCNKVGTYLKALAAHDNNVPFYVALPSPTIDPYIDDGINDIKIEERSAREVTHIRGQDEDGRICDVNLLPATSPTANPAFDVTPARLVTGLLTERGVAPASRAGLAALFPELFAQRAQV